MPLVGAARAATKASRLASLPQPVHRQGNSVACMPEGPSIVILREQAQKFAGQVVREVSGNSRQDIQRMHGRKVRAVCSWGKHFLLDFDGFVLRIHFMLFGRSRVDDPKEGGTPRLTLKFDNGRLDLYACSVQFLEGQVDELYDWSVDVMADAWDPAMARKRLRESRRRPARPGVVRRRRQHHQERSAVADPRAPG